MLKALLWLEKRRTASKPKCPTESTAVKSLDVAIKGPCKVSRIPTTVFGLQCKCRFGSHRSLFLIVWSECLVIVSAMDPSDFVCRLRVARLDDVPNVLGGVAKLTASHAGAKAEVADGDCIVLESVCKIIVAFGHSTNENTDAFLWS
jgi:hypothetical protein